MISFTESSFSNSASTSFFKSCTNTDGTTEYMFIASLNLVVILLYLAGNGAILYISSMMYRDNGLLTMYALNLYGSIVTQELRSLLIHSNKILQRIKEWLLWQDSLLSHHVNFKRKKSSHI